MTVVTHPHRGDTVWLVPIASDYERIPPGAEPRCSAPTTRGRPAHAHERSPSKTYTNVLRDAACTDTDAEGPGFYFGTRNGDVYGATAGVLRCFASYSGPTYCVRSLTLP